MLVGAPLPSPSPSVIYVQQAGGGVRSWVVPVIVGILAQLTALGLYFLGRWQSNKRRFDNDLRDLCGQMSAATVIVSGFRKDRNEALDRLLQAFVAQEFISPPTIDRLAHKLYDAAYHLVLTDPSDVSTGVNLRLELTAAHDAFRNEVRRHFGLTELKTDLSSVIEDAKEKEPPT